MNLDEKLNKIVDINTKLENPDMGIDEGLKLYEEGVSIAKEVLGELNSIKGKINIIKKELDVFKEESLD